MRSDVMSMIDCWDAFLVRMMGCSTYSFNDIVNEFLGFDDFLFGISHDETMKVFFLVAGVSRVRSTLALFDRALATDGNLRL